MNPTANATPATPVTKPNGATAMPESPAGQPTYAELVARLAQLEAEKHAPVDKVQFRIAEKGGISAVGIGRFPTTLYYEQWISLLDASERVNLRKVLAEHLAAGRISLKAAKDEKPEDVSKRSMLRGQADLAAIK